MLLSFQQKRSRQRGSVLVISVVLAGLGTIGIAAWISLLDARSHQVEQDLVALKRRAVRNNSRALAYRALYANHLHSGQPLAADATYTIPGGVGEAVIRAYAAVPLQNQSSSRTTKNGATAFRSYTTDVSVSVSDGSSTQTWNYQLRNYNPVLGGELLAVHPVATPTDPAPIVDGSIRVRGRAVLWDAVTGDLAAGIRADEFLLCNDILNPTTFANPSGNTVLPLNYPIPLQTTGVVPSGGPYSGNLDIVRSTTNAHNAYAYRIGAAGNQISLNANLPSSVGPGPATRADKPDDATLETQIASQTPDTLMATLPASYPLSSRILRAVAEKNNPAFSVDQIFTIFDAHTPIPNDALTHLMGPYRDRIGSRTNELHRSNGTAYSTDGNGTIRVYLESPLLPHLIIDQVSEMWLYGQESNPDAAAAASLEPRAVIVGNAAGYYVDTVHFEEQNRRRLVLAVSTENGLAPENYLPDFLFDANIPFPSWRAIIDLQNTGAEIDTTAVAGATLVGGIRANRRIDVTGGSLILTREYEYEGFEHLLSRNAWVEAYRQ